jgi:hypothetical protein
MEFNNQWNAHEVDAVDDRGFVDVRCRQPERVTEGRSDAVPVSKSDHLRRFTFEKVIEMSGITVVYC